MTILNDLSFIGQAQDAYEASGLIRALGDTWKALRRTTNDSQPLGHSELYSRFITPGVSVLEWLHARRQSIADRDTALLLLMLSKQGPFIDRVMQESGDTCCCLFGDVDIAFHGLAGAAHRRARLLSLTGAGSMSEPELVVHLCGNERCDCTVQNFTTEESVRRVDRIYTPSRKHSPGGWGTKMDLDDATAQKILREGVLVGRRVYAKHENNYYAFYDDNADGYHGFPIPTDAVPNEALAELDR